MKPSYYALIKSKQTPNMEEDRIIATYNLRTTKVNEAISMIKDNLDLSKQVRDQLKAINTSGCWKDGSYYIYDLVEVYELTP